MSLEGLFKQFVDVVDIVSNFWIVPISRVFALYELELSTSLVGRVSDEFSLSIYIYIYIYISRFRTQKPGIFQTNTVKSRAHNTLFCPRLPLAAQ